MVPYLLVFIKRAQLGYISSARYYSNVRTCSLTVKGKLGGNAHSRIRAIVADVSRTLMSFRRPGLPKKRCHIHNFLSAMASNNTASMLLFFSLKLSTPSNWTVIPLPVLKIDTANTTREPLCHIYLHLSSLYDVGLSPSFRAGTPLQTVL